MREGKTGRELGSHILRVQVAQDVGPSLGMRASDGKIGPMGADRFATEKEGEGVAIACAVLRSPIAADGFPKKMR